MAQLDSPTFTKTAFKLHIAIDFGTDGLGLAYAVDKKVFVHSKWNAEKYRDVVKPKTIILLDKDGKAEQFGLDAKEVYMRLACKKDLMLFERFKMSLYDDQIPHNDASDNKHGDGDEEKANKQIDIKTQLKAANGTLYPAEKVFVAAFQFVGEETKRFLRKQKIKANKTEIQWILTCPAIWSDAAKNKMKQWIIRAGLVDINIPSQCKVVYEPDCASLSIQHEIANRKSEDANVNFNFNKGEKYILVDAGGGTCDIVCHEILGEFGVKEVLSPSGGPWGSCYIDDEYETCLTQIFGEMLMAEFKNKHPNIYMQLIHNFQRAKTGFYAQKCQHHNCRLPDDFIAWLEDKFEEDTDLNAETIVANSVMGQSHLAVLHDEMLELSNVVWISMFDAVIDPILSHIKKLLDGAKLMSNCKYLCCVGGLSCSKYFQYKMESYFGIQSGYKLQLIIPQRPILSVVQGAAYFGITGNYIKARRLRATYGVTKFWSINRARNNGISEEWIKKHTDGNNNVHGCFSIVAQKNTEIHTNQIISIQGVAGSKISVITIAYSNLLHPKTIADAKLLATVHIDNGENWNQHKRITVEYHFYDTTIKVYAYHTDKPENKKSVDLIYQ